MSRSDRFFLVVQRTSNVLVLLFAVAFLAMLGKEWLDMRRYKRDAERFGSDFEPTVPYSAREIETTDGTLTALMQSDGSPGERIAQGGVTVTNPKTGKFVEIATTASPNMIQFEPIHEQGDDGNTVGYYATIASREQWENGRQDLVVGALPAMTRNVIARDLRYVDVAGLRSEGIVGIQIWPEEGEAYLIAVRLNDGAIVERTRVKLPALRQRQSSDGD